jgi:hypothetical protein
MDDERREREQGRKRSMGAKKKIEEISLLEFTRQVVEMIIQKHSDTYNDVISQREVVPSVSKFAREEVKLQHGSHLIKLTELRGVCKYCKKRSKYCCDRCDVALHPDCFYIYHRPEEEK